MKRTKPKPRTKAQQDRFNRIKRIGCLIARIRGEGFVPCEIHHLTRMGKRDHDKTIGLSPWRHRGIVAPGYTSTAMTETFGPSFAKGSRIFAAAYGSDMALLLQQNVLLKADGIMDDQPSKVPDKFATVSDREILADIKRITRQIFGPRPRPDRKPATRSSKILPPRAATWKPPA